MKPAPSDQIWALVSGLPEPRRSGRLLMVLQAHIDDSSTEEPSIYVLAGYLATSESWAKFSAAWQEILDARPSIDYFKMSEAMGFAGQFAHWSEDRRNERLRLFRTVIEEHVLGEFSCAYSPKALRKVYGRHEWFGRSPYYFGHSQVTLGLARNLAGFGLDTQPVDFVFDDQMAEKGKVIEAWEYSRPKAKMNPPALRDILKNLPSFRDDKDVLPLQAADMHAWCIRETYEAAYLGRGRPAFPWTPGRNIRGMAQSFNEAQLREYQATMLERSRVSQPPAP